jgi:hypothetical protein
MEVMINQRLAKQKGLSKDRIIAINELHKQSGLILMRPNHYGEPEDVLELLTAIEYSLQLLWGFPTDRAFHHYSFSLEGCNCPYDHDRDFGNPFKRINSTCPWHGTPK